MDALILLGKLSLVMVAVIIIGLGASFTWGSLLEPPGRASFIWLIGGIIVSLMGAYLICVCVIWWGLS